MQFFRVKYLSFFFLLVSIFSFFNIIYSYYFNFFLNLNTYYISLISSLLISILFYKIKTNPNKPSIFEKILTVIIGYILLNIILSIPFYFSIYNLSFLNALFVNSFSSSLSKLIDDGGKSDYFESAIAPLLNTHNVYFEDITHLPCIEIDFNEDLQKANQLVKNKLYNN